MDVIGRRAPDWPPRGDRDHIFLNVILDDSIFLTKTNPAATIQARISLLGSSGLLTLWLLPGFARAGRPLSGRRIAHSTRPYGPPILSQRRRVVSDAI